MTNLTITQTDTVADVFRNLRAVLDEEHLIDEYFSISGPSEQPFWNLVESYRWIACDDHGRRAATTILKPDEY